MVYVPVIINVILERRYIYPVNNTCTIDYSNPTLLVTITVSFFIPCLLMLAAYGKIFKVARKQEERVHEMAQVANTVN